MSLDDIIDRYAEPSGATEQAPLVGPGKEAPGAFLGSLGARRSKSAGQEIRDQIRLVVVDGQMRVKLFMKCMEAGLWAPPGEPE